MCCNKLIWLTCRTIALHVSTVCLLVFNIMCFQLSAQTSDKEVALQQIALLQGQMRECEQHVHELEAAKEQLEQNVFSIQNSHQQLEILHTQV